MPLYSEGTKNRRIGTDPADHSDAAMNAMAVDARALTKERIAIRTKMEPEGIAEIEKISGGKYSFLRHQRCKAKADKIIEDIEQKQKPRSKEKLSPEKNTERG